MANAYTNDELVFLTRLTERAGRYAEMRSYVTSLVQQGYNLDTSERQLFSVAYRECISVHRNTWRTLHTLLKSEQSAETIAYSRSLISAAESSIKSISRDILSLLSKHLLPTCANPESKVYYLKLEGDYKRYMAEISSGKEHAEWSEDCHNSYKSAADLALSCLKPVDPTRLGLFMNFSVFYYEVYNSPERACILAKAACDEAIDGGLEYAAQNVEKEGEHVFAGSAEIVRLMQNNLSKWAARLVASAKKK
jgi:14-3-3 protein epsilon